MINRYLKSKNYIDDQSQNYIKLLKECDFFPDIKQCLLILSSS